MLAHFQFTRRPTAGLLGTAGLAAPLLAQMAARAQQVGADEPGQLNVDTLPATLVRSVDAMLGAVESNGGPITRRG
jgi:hypothetical protein